MQLLWLATTVRACLLASAMWHAHVRASFNAAMARRPRQTLTARAAASGCKHLTDCAAYAVRLWLTCVLNHNSDASSSCCRQPLCQLQPNIGSAQVCRCCENSDNRW